jgi:hypothetical protein
MPKRLVICLLSVLVAATATTASSAETTAKWTRVTDASGDSTDEVAPARTADGVLHVVWRKRLGPGRDAVAHTTVSPAGKVGGSSLAAAPFAAITNPDLAVGLDGSLRVFFGAQTGITESSGIRTASRGPGAASWSLDSARISASTVTPSAVGAVVGARGDPIVSWVTGPQLLVHSGSSAGDPDQQLGPSKGCCFNQPGLVTSGVETLMGFHSNIRGQSGIFVRRVSPTMGFARLAPGSATGGAAIEIDQRLPITARIGVSGVYVAYCGGYPECHRVLLWRVGAAKATTVGTGADVEAVNVAAGPEGRIWVLWEDNDANRLYARRSSRSVSCMGAVVGVHPPAGSDPVWTLTGEGSLGPLDLFANVAPSVTAKAATWHTRILPGLTVSARGGSARITIEVTDACDPVAGAKVKVGGKTLTTNASGLATVDLPPGSFVAVASKSGYTSGSARITSR